MIRINYLDEREWVVKREIDTNLVMTSMTPKNYGTQVLPEKTEAYEYSWEFDWKRWWNELVQFIGLNGLTNCVINF